MASALARAASGLLARRREAGLPSGALGAQPGVGKQRPSVVRPKEPLNPPSKPLRYVQKTGQRPMPGPKQPSTPPPAALRRKLQVQALREQRAAPGPKQPGAPPPIRLALARAKQPAALPPQRLAQARAKQPAAPPPKKLVQDRTPQSKRPRLANAPAAGPFPEDAPLHISFPSEYEAPDLLDGCAADALAICIEGKKKGREQQTDAILANYFDQEEADIEYSEGNTQKDDSWELFPGVGAALQEVVPGTTELFCIATSQRHGVWGVGVSNSGRCRYQASRIALALKLCARSAEEGEDMDLSEHSAIAALYAKLEDGNSAVARPATQPARQNRSSPATQPARQKQNSRQSKTSPEPSAKVSKSPSTFPKDVQVWLNLENSKPELLADFPDEALFLCSDGKTKGAMYAKADAVLAHVLGGSIEDDEVEFHDDPDWSKFPEIGAALDEIAEQQECFCLAMCHTHNVWAVGLCSRGQARFSTAKVALAASIYTKVCDDTGELDLSAFPAFEEFIIDAAQQI